MYKKKFYINIFLYKLCVKFAHNAVLHIVYKNNLQESCDIYLYNNCKQFYIKKNTSIPKTVGLAVSSLENE